MNIHSRKFLKFFRCAILMLIASTIGFYVLINNEYIYISPQDELSEHIVKKQSDLITLKKKSDSTSLSNSSQVSVNTLETWLDLISDTNIKESEKYSICLRLSDQENYPKAMLQRLASTFDFCRLVRNRYGISAERLEKWKEVRQIIRNDGWEVLIKGIELGLYSVDISLQEGEPRHDLFVAFAAEGIQDIEAYNALSNLGLKPNIKLLSVGLANNNLKILDYYTQNADLFAVDDMGYNVFYTAAIFGAGQLDSMQYMLDLGVAYQDKLGRDALAEVITRHGVRVNTEQFLTFIDNNQLPVNPQLLQAAKKFPELHQELKKRQSVD
ncbi:hypothetical protein ACWXWU_05270 [Shewanella sp. A14]